MTMIADYIVFEHPVNELMRACLRLEHLIKQATHGMRSYTTWESRLALTAITDTLNLIERPDLRTKLTKELRRFLTNLGKLEHSPHINRQKLSALLIELEDLIDILNATHGRLAKNLRENDFLNTIRNHLLTPGGAFTFDVPAYYLWLQQPAEKKSEDIGEWLKSFDPLVSSVNLLLNLVRTSAQEQHQIANEGFFQMTINPQAPCQLIRVAVPMEGKIFPEINVGRHGLAVRFYNLSMTDRPSQTKNDIHFKLTLCII